MVGSGDIFYGIANIAVSTSGVPQAVCVNRQLILVPSHSIAQSGLEKGPLKLYHVNKGDGKNL